MNTLKSAMLGSTKVRVLAAAAGVLFLSVAAIAPAHAASSDESKVVTSQECLDQVAAAVAADPSADVATDLCSYTISVDVSEPQRLSVADAKKVTGLSGADKAALVESVLAGAVQSKHYSQALTGAAWTTTQNGTFYYNGSRAWITNAYLGYTGSHNCFVNYSAGFGLSLQGCSEWGDNTYRGVNQSWYVQPLNTPIGWSAGSTMYVHSNGATSW